MNRRRFWTGLVAAAGVLTMLQATVVLQSDDTARGGTWGAVGADAGNTRYSDLAQITGENVTRLGAGWISPKLETNASTRAMPVVKDGVMFLTVPPSVYALNARTGAIIWRFQGGGGRGRGPTTPRMGNPGREGVALGAGLVFVGLSDARVVALDEKTGALVWNVYVGDNPRDKGQVISGAPLFAGGLVSVGLSADNGWRGQVVALDPKTGAEAWRFFAIPGPGKRATRPGRRPIPGPAAARPSGWRVPPMPRWAPCIT